MEDKYVLDYEDENNYRKTERGLKAINVIAWKKLWFDIYPMLKKGEFIGELKSSTPNGDYYEYNFEVEPLFREVYGEIILRYHFETAENAVVLDELEPNDILLKAYKSELIPYKGIMIFKANAQKEMFKIDLLCRLEGRE